MRLLKFEDKVKNWIENHKFKWLFLLFGLGSVLGIIENYFLGGTFTQGFVISFIYSFFLITCEFAAGGSGIN